jgi:hypothetical protein
MPETVNKQICGPRFIACLWQTQVFRGGIIGSSKARFFAPNSAGIRPDKALLLAADCNFQENSIA